MPLKGRRRLLTVIAVLALSTGAGLLWLRIDQPITTAKQVYEANGLALSFGGEYLDIFKVPAAGTVCGGYRGKDINGRFQAPSTFIVWFQTRDWFSWRDPVLLRPTPTDPAWEMGSGDPAEDQRRWDEDRAKLAKERATNDYYRYAEACQNVLAARRRAAAS